jgi:WD40 repeat protein
MGHRKRSITQYLGRSYSLCFNCCFRLKWTFASGSGDKTIKLWNTTTGQLTNILKDNTCLMSISNLVSNQNGVLVSGSFDGILKLWNTQTGKLIYTGAVMSLALDKNGIFASASKDYSIKLWNTQFVDLWLIFLIMLIGLDLIKMIHLLELISVFDK